VDIRVLLEVGFVSVLWHVLYLIFESWNDNLEIMF
jgi:hypothetical protein